MTLLTFILFLYAVLVLERRVGDELERLQGRRDDAPHGFIDFNLHNT